MSKISIIEKKKKLTKNLIWKIIFLLFTETELFAFEIFWTFIKSFFIFLNNLDFIKESQFIRTSRLLYQIFILYHGRQRRHFIWSICIMTSQPLMGYRKPKFDSFVNIWFKREGIIIIIIIIIIIDHRNWKNVKKKKDKYLDLARELKKLWNMKVTIVPIVIGAFGTITKGLLKALEDLEVVGRVETIQTTALLRTARIPRRVLETWGDLLSLKLQWKTIS